MKKTLLAAALIAASISNASTASGDNQVIGTIMAMRVAIACPQLKINIEKVVNDFENTRRNHHMSREHAAGLTQTVDAWQRQEMAHGNFCQVQAERLIASGYINFIR